ncbi:hypothetical protein [Poseidonocella sp. HB161398]|uniref:hypothetical protein n=1 Tax=Poseidonocella sp. HB161398 TaxID=2320855 RepID=UPI001F101737|nr:hypothetical protein [Poseidonocella sp. HB161398]
MAVRKQSVSFTDAAFAYAKALVERGDDPNVSAAVSGELARAKTLRDRDQALFEAELRRRLATPLDQWVPVGSLDALFAGAEEALEGLRSDPDGTGTAQR